MSRLNTNLLGDGARALLGLASAIPVACLALFFAAGPTAPTNSLRTAPVVCVPRVPDTEEIHIPSAANGCRVILGSLGDAGTVYPIRIQSKAAADAVTSLSDCRELTVAIITSQPKIRLVSWSSNSKTAPIIRRSSVSQRLFFLQTGTNPQAESSYQPIHARRVADFSRVSFWQDVAGEHGPSSAELAELARRLEEDILPNVTQFYGDITDVDGDGKLAVCLTSKLSQLPAEESAVEGLVQVNDFQPDLPRPFSNQADVIFLSEALRDGPQAVAVLTHEAAHLAVFSRRCDVAPESLASEDDWLNEGFAHFAETHCSEAWSNLRDRLAAFRENPALSPLVVTDAQRQGLWRQPGSRAAAWHFLQWLADEYGPEVVAELARRPEIGCDKVQCLVHEPWPELFRRWSVAMWLREIAGEPSVVVQPSTTELTLRGTAHHAWRLDGRNVAWKITAPREARLQVTVVEESTGTVRVVR